MDPIVINVEIKVSAEDKQATVIIPPEIRLTERLVSFLNEAVKARDLVLTHWTISPEQEKDLENLSNVVVEETE